MIFIYITINYMQKDLLTEIKRIQEIIYQDTNLLEQVYDKTKNTVTKKTDISSRADLLSSSPEELINTIKHSIKTGGISQQKKGTMTFQKEVEALQVALVLLGYSLPKFGIDGLYGSETAAAVKKFKTKNNIMNESIEELRSTIDNLGYEEKGQELTSGGQIGDEITKIVSEILKDFKQLSPKTAVKITSGNDSFHQQKISKSKHPQGRAIDITINPYNNETAGIFSKIVEKYKKQYNLYFLNEYVNKTENTTGGHFHIQYNGEMKPISPIPAKVKDKATDDTTINVTGNATSEMLSKVIEKLSLLDISPEDIKPYLDPSVEPSQTSNGTSTLSEIDLSTNEGYQEYSKICNDVIRTYKSNPLKITGEMLANGAMFAFKNTGKYIPPEFALAQLLIEGGLNSSATSKPVKTNNPFNIGNYDNGKTTQFKDLQKAINTYYNTIANNYITDKKSANDLLNDFSNKNGDRYTPSVDYETKLAQVINSINKRKNIA